MHSDYMTADPSIDANTSFDQSTACVGYRRTSSRSDASSSSSLTTISSASSLVARSGLPVTAFMFPSPCAVPPPTLLVSRQQPSSPPSAPVTRLQRYRPAVLQSVQRLREALAPPSPLASTPHSVAFYPSASTPARRSMESTSSFGRLLSLPSQTVSEEDLSEGDVHREFYNDTSSDSIASRSSSLEAESESGAAASPLPRPQASTKFMLLPEGHTEHIGQWVRIRTKRGLQYYTCKACGLYWCWYRSPKDNALEASQDCSQEATGAPDPGV